MSAGNPALSVIPLDAALENLQHSGATVEVVHPDNATESVFFAAAGGVLDPSVRAPAAKAAFEQGKRLATERLVTFWN